MCTTDHSTTGRNFAAPPAGPLASSQELKGLLEADADIKSGFHAVAKLAWGIMVYITGDDNNQTHGKHGNTD